MINRNNSNNKNSNMIDRNNSNNKNSNTINRNNNKTTLAVATNNDRRKRDFGWTDRLCCSYVNSVDLVIISRPSCCLRGTTAATYSSSVGRTVRRLMSFKCSCLVAVGTASSCRVQLKCDGTR